MKRSRTSYNLAGMLESAERQAQGGGGGGGGGRLAVYSARSSTDLRKRRRQQAASSPTAVPPPPMPRPPPPPCCSSSSAEEEASPLLTGSSGWGWIPLSPILDHGDQDLQHDDEEEGDEDDLLGAVGSGAYLGGCGSSPPSPCSSTPTLLEGAGSRHPSSGCLSSSSTVSLSRSSSISGGSSTGRLLRHYSDGGMGLSTLLAASGRSSMHCFPTCLSTGSLHQQQHDATGSDMVVGLTSELDHLHLQHYYYCQQQEAEEDRGEESSCCTADEQASLSAVMMAGESAMLAPPDHAALSRTSSLSSSSSSSSSPPRAAAAMEKALAASGGKWAGGRPQQQPSIDCCRPVLPYRHARGGMWESSPLGAAACK